MIKCRIHIRNEGCYMDDNVFVEIQLPCLPQVGNTIFLSEEEESKLKQMATKNIEIAKNYAPEWFYGKSSKCNNPKEENLKDLSFGDSRKVKEVLFRSNSEIVDIEIDSE